MELLKLTKSQQMSLIGSAFSLEKKKFLKENVVEFGLYYKQNFDPEIMEKALNFLVEHTEALRTKLIRKNVHLYQVVKEYSYQHFERNTVKNRAEFVELVNNNPYVIQLFSDSLVGIRIVICTEEKQAGGCMICCHHMCCDGYSLDLIHEELDAYYESFSKGETPVANKEYSMKKVLELEEKYRKSPSYKEDKKYWWHQYNHQPHYSFPVGRIPWKTDLAEASYLLEGENYERFFEFCRENDLTSTSVLMTIGAITVRLLSNDTNFAMYTLTHGRNTKMLRQTVGCLMNTYPIFYNVDDSLTLKEYMEETYRNYLVALSHGRYSAGEQILMAAKETYIKRFGYNHIWIEVSTMDYLNGTENELSEVIDPIMRNTTGVFYCALLNKGQDLLVDLLYQKKCFSDVQVRNMLRVFGEVLQFVINHPEKRIEDLCREISKKD